MSKVQNTQYMCNLACSIKGTCIKIHIHVGTCTCTLHVFRNASLTRAQLMCNYMYYTLQTYKCIKPLCNSLYTCMPHA